MAVKTAFSREDFSKILSNYHLGEYRSSKYFTHGWVQTTILLMTTGGKFVLRYYENRTERHVLFEVSLLNYLGKKKYPVPAVIKNSFGKFLGEYKGKPYIIIEYIDGGSIKKPNNVFDYIQLSEAVKLVAKLHNITKGHRPEYYKNHTELNIKYCWKKYRERSKKARNNKREKWLKNELIKLKFPNSLPRGICHCDFNYSNLLFKKEKIIAVLDFDISCYTYLIYDIASLIYWWAWPPKKELQTKKAKYILKEYSKHRKLNKSEKNHIYDALKLIILLGISWSKESDFEQEKRKVKYLNSIGRKEFYNRIFN